MTQINLKSINEFDEFDILGDDEITLSKFGNVKLPYNKIEQLIDELMKMQKCKNQIGVSLKQFIQLMNDNGIGYAFNDKNGNPKRLGNVVQTFRNSHKQKQFKFDTHSKTFRNSDYIVFVKTD